LWFPKQLLSHQFWKQEQLLEIGQDEYNVVRGLYPKLLNLLNEHADRELNLVDDKAKNVIFDLTKQIIDNKNSNYDIIQLKSIFNRKEFDLNRLNQQHFVSLKYNFKF
jgi:hypothetical protein